MGGHRTATLDRPRAPADASARNRRRQALGDLVRQPLRARLHTRRPGLGRLHGLRLHWHGSLLQPGVDDRSRAATFETEAVGGRTGGLGTHTDVAESFDPGHREWLALPPAPVAVSEAAAARIGDLFISIGGLSEHTYWAETSVYAFNVATGTWTRLPDLVYPSHGAAAAAAGGRLYALGGTDNGERFAASNDSHSLEERHIPASD